MTLSKEKLMEMYKTMSKIRKFEFQTAKSFAEGDVLGFVHLYIGEEAIATGVCANLNKDDYITSTHRGHGHCIAKGADMNRMMAELCGRETGYCKGKGGSMHIANSDLGMLGANGIVGGGFNLANGAAFSSKMLKNGRVCVCFFGDGSTGTGAFHEAMNLASTWKLPVVFINENNKYAVSCRITNAMNIDHVADRALAYNMPHETIDGNDVIKVYETVQKAIEFARSGNGPYFVECETFRWRGHFEGEPENYRNMDEVTEWKSEKHDPIVRFENYLKENGIATEEEIAAVNAEVDAEVANALKFALESPYPDKQEALKDVYTDIVEEGR